MGITDLGRSEKDEKMICNDWFLRTLSFFKDFSETFPHVNHLKQDLN